MTPDPLAELVEILARGAVAEYLGEIAKAESEPPVQEQNDG